MSKHNSNGICTEATFIDLTGSDAHAHHTSNLISQTINQQLACGK